MLVTRYGFLFGSVETEFPSHFSLEESVERLRAMVRPGEFWLLRQAVVGTVEKGEVHLKRGGPSTSKAYRVHFEGAFHVRDAEVILSGQFIVNGRGEVERFISTTVFESVVYFFLIAPSLSSVFGKLLNSWFLLLIPLAVVGFQLLGRAKRRESAHEDIEWLSDKMRDALCGHPITE